ncbi:hypothetical protein [Streptomyces acidiscabies]|uniref:Uncharacterized protein n=1 Tax=Streptomyces acidiscabies TaxID=42234 RepID=A0AAP6B6K3_9ACTN|nr:hypothetical protein [Streptomyces acidiscabies]MBZ3911123.1 hypothetical protein [Streptomyces acidiscabies]MDX2959096.1 hypothetical protein [Streptomyces acidiscabies]MDX3023944.1 hypothetical protein [Streptomyces acidiscabies]MDX3788235.1 hypothetical protein [Streptomyces acidiscabies]GAQ53006.1 hypothetical protein a10_02802 [Streptomyces acidiscabies]
MNDANTTQRPYAETHGSESGGAGRHRGPQSAHDAETASHGRHRRPAEQVESAAA